MSKSYLTKEGYQKLKAEIDHLVSIERPGLSVAIADARDKGDLSENAEYDAAKEAQGYLETKIAVLQSTLRQSQIIDESQIDTTSVQLLNKVLIKNVKNGMTVEYTIVPVIEASIKEKKISIETPIAKGLLGKKVGDIAEISVPAGVMEFEIVNISI